MDKALAKIKNIYWGSESITILPLFCGAEKHRHYMLHIFINIKCAGCVQVEGRSLKGKMIIVASGVEHAVLKGDKWEIIMLINPTAILAQGIQDYLGEKKAIGIEEAEIEIFEQKHLFNLSLFMERIYAFFHITQRDNQEYDDRIRTLLREIEQGNWLAHTVPELAEQLHLSPSRLTHLFKQETHMKLKSYLVMHKLIAAYILLNQGKNVTQAAMYAGFDSPAHMAAVNKRMTGLRVTDILKTMK